MPNPVADRTAEGIYNIDTLRKLGETPGSRFLVEGLIRATSVNIVAGNSALGKTPLMVTLAVAVASGTEFLGLPTTQGDVFICDVESDQGNYLTLLEQISRAAGLPDVPKNIQVWSPNWDTRTLESSYGDALMKRLDREKAALSIIDTLRSFFPDMEKETDATVARYNQLRKMGGANVFVHHLRKMSNDADRLVEDPHHWLQNAAGSHALINGTDLRLGVEREKNDDDLVLAGILRGKGRIAPIYLTRDYDSDGDVLGYRRLLSLDRLKDEHRATLNKLPEVFGFADAKRELPTKGASAAMTFLNEVMEKAGVVRLEGKKGYRKPSKGGVSGGLALAA